MNKRLENKINLWYGESLATKLWLGKRWHRWITYGCSICEEECKGHQDSIMATYSKGYGDINSPKGFAEISEYAYNEYFLSES